MTEVTRLGVELLEEGGVEGVAAYSNGGHDTIL